MLLQFTMQMTLILVLSLILGATPAFKNAVIFLSRLPRTQAQVMVLAVLCRRLRRLPELGPVDRARRR